MKLEREVLSAPDKVGIRGLTVEEAGRQWAKEYFKRRGGDLSKVVLVMNSEDLWILDLPSITERKLGVRIDGLGYLRTLEWKPKIIDEHNGIRTLHNPRQVNYQLLYPSSDRVEIGYMANIPRRRERVQALEPKTSATIEAAIRLQEHAIQRGQETASQAVEVINFSQGIVGAFLNERISQKDLEQQTDDFLLKIGLVNPQAFDKIKIQTMLSHAPLLDSLGRRNSLVKQIRWRAAYLAAVRQKVFAGLVADKYAENKIQLEFEREFTRWTLSEAGDLLKMKLQAHAGFKKQGGESYGQRRILEQIMVEEIAHGLLTIPRVKPYLAAARLAGISLTGCRPQFVETNRMIIDNEKAWSWLTNQDSVAQMVAGNRFKEADKRVEEIKAVIDNVLQ